MEQEVFEGTGIIEEKIEAISKKGAYWKYKIVLEGNEKPNTFNFFDYEAGSKVKTGEKVKLFWRENEGEYDGQSVTYRNVKSIFKLDEENGKSDPLLSKQSNEQLAQAQKEADNAIDGTPIKSAFAESKVGGGRLSYNEGARIGMIFNNAVQLCIAECKYTNLDIEKRFTSLKKLLDELEG